MKSRHQVRKAISATALHKDGGLITCDDGTLWKVRVSRNEWKVLNVPQYEVDPMRKTVKGEGHPAVTGDE